jgi:hypothetical protein
MTFRQALHRQLEALGRGGPHSRLFATPLEIHEAADVALAVLHLLYCEDAPGKPPLRSQSKLTLAYRLLGGKWTLVQNQHRALA